MLGAIYGDVVGSRFEFSGFDSYDFDLFHPSCHYTDDTLMTMAVAKTIEEAKDDKANYQKTLIRNMRDIAHRYPRVAWGGMFYKWLFEYEVPVPLHSYGNGAAMRISPVGWVCDSLEETIELSKLTTEITHDHPEGIKGAEAVAVAIFMARNSKTKEEIRAKMVSYYKELADMSIARLKESGYGLDEPGKCVTCQGSVPQAICAFLESDNFIDAIRKAVSLGADSDTQAAIAGSIAEAYYGLGFDDEAKVLPYLPKYLQYIYFKFKLIRKKRIN